jgi:hypothetical protein
VADTEIEALAHDKLGARRHWLRGELRVLPRCLAHGERVLSMAMVLSGVRSQGPVCLIAATDRRLLLLLKSPFQPLRWHDLPYKRLTSARVEQRPQRRSPILVIRYDDTQQAWQVMPRRRTAEFAALVTERIDTRKVPGMEPNG